MTAGPAIWTEVEPRRAVRFAVVRRWLLPVSLLANVFLLAHAAGPWLRPERARGFPGMVDHFARSLPPGDAERFRAAMARERPGFDDARREMDRARGALSRAIAATPYDPAVASDRMAEWQERLGGMSGRFGSTLLAVIPELSAEGRARLADAADHPPPPPGPTRDGQRDGPRDGSPPSSP